MGCMLGRAVLPSPDKIRQEGGGKLRIGHSGYPFDGDEGLVMAQQVLGYPNPDEEVVFFTYDATAADGVLDGAYFVASTNVDWVKLAAGVFSWDAELVAVPGQQLPIFQVACVGDDLVNSHAFTGLNWASLPASALTRNLPAGAFTTDADLVGGGEITLVTDSTLADTSLTYAIEPENVYEGAARLTVEGAEVSGRQVARTSLGWVIENGLVRVRPSLTEVNHLIVGVADGTDWVEYAYRLGDGNTGDPVEFGYDGITRYPPTGIIVLRNSPECVSIRVAYPDSFANQLDGGGFAAYDSSLSVDITLRRGQTYADFYVLTDNAAAKELGVWRGSTDASASITGGVEDAAAVGGVKWQIYTPATRTADNTNGGLYQTATSETFAFAVGSDIDVWGLGASFDFHDAYFAAQEHFQEAASR